jgi:hypothetical protein
LKQKVKNQINQKFSQIFSPGDITQKGYEKKRQRLLAPYLSATAVTGSTNNNNGNASSQGQGESRIRDQFAFVLPDFFFLHFKLNNERY